MDAADGCMGGWGEGKGLRGRRPKYFHLK